MYVYKIKRLSDGVITHTIETEDSNYTPKIPNGWNLEDNHEIIKELKNSYIENRVREYGSIGSQLDEIYHDMDAWKARIKSIKDKYPKE